MAGRAFGGGGAGRGCGYLVNVDPGGCRWGGQQPRAGEPGASHLTAAGGGVAHVAGERPGEMITSSSINRPEAFQDAYNTEAPPHREHPKRQPRPSP